MAAMLSVIMPVLNEGESVAASLGALATLRSRGVEIIVVDGGSRDSTVELARPLADRLIIAPRGRALQMNAGAARAAGEVLLFLHADTRLPEDADALVIDGLAGSGRDWGRFDVTIAGKHPLLPVIGWFMGARSRLSGVCTGDQAIFVRRKAFHAAGGFPAIPLMEDVALCKRLKRISPPLCLRERVVTSGRRWEKNGAIRTILLMWRLRMAFLLGVDPRKLALRYGYE
jgi:rSAM/selenodomain-associated transferase 2